MGICDKCKAQFPFEAVVSALNYNEIIQSLVHNFKYNEFKKIGKFLGNFLTNRLEKLPFAAYIDFVIPVPLHKVKKRERGFNQAEIISRVISKNLNIPFSSKIVKRRKYTKSQTTLNKSDRQMNVSNAFEVRKPDLIENKNILLVDDVLTTGSTLKSVAIALGQSKKVGKIYAVTVARA